MAKQINKAEQQVTPTHVALLRGINVGGKNILPMVELATLCTRAGCAGVQTYIQSGNVLFHADAACAKAMPELVENAIEKRFAFRPKVVVRTAREMRQIVDGNPFLRDAADTSPLYIGYLSSKPTAAQISALDPNRSPGDSYRVIGREIYMNLGNGAADTKLTTAYFDSKLATISTFRNWRTTLRLLEMLSSTQ